VSLTITRAAHGTRNIHTVQIRERMVEYIMMTVARGMAYDLDGNFFHKQADLIPELMTRGRGAFAALP
jgi:hypothetical protein